MIGGRTRVFALLGDPVAHSLSPAMQNAAFRALGVDAVYVAVRADARGLGSAMRVLASSGGGGNVTIPHKRDAAACLDEGILPSCNVFWGQGDQLVGGSTDEAGILAGWEQLGRPTGAWLVLGTGGSALAAVRAGSSIGAPFTVRSRSEARRREFEQLARVGGGTPALAQHPVGLVINCTPLGWAESDPDPLPVAEFPVGAAALDLVYGRRGTRWTRSLIEAGIPAVDGRVALVAQGALAFELWFPGVEAPREVMHAAVEQALR